MVDDEQPVRETLAEMLVAVNHKVELAGSGQEAVQKMRTGEFDFVFTDLAMPEMDGWETARMIRKDWPNVRIVLVTGYGPTTAPPAGEEDLVDAIIGKPFDFAQVGSTLNALTQDHVELHGCRVVKVRLFIQALIEIHNSGAGSKSNSKPHHHCRTGPFVLLSQHKTRRSTR